LALTRSIIELHHGTVDAISEGAGKGSEFVIKLPLAAAERRLEESIMIRSATVVPVTRRKRILVVDDNVDAATMLCTLLQNMGHEVAIANTGAEALRLAESDRPQVVCLDIGMPGMDGLEIARRIRQRDRHPRPLIIAITGWGQPEDQAQSQEAGIDVHLLKPAEKVTLCRILDQHAEAA
jgi:CheY-like chemotaxis protein